MFWTKDDVADRSCDTNFHVVASSGTKSKSNHNQSHKALSSKATIHLKNHLQAPAKHLIPVVSGVSEDLRSLSYCASCTSGIICKNPTSLPFPIWCSSPWLLSHSSSVRLWTYCPLHPLGDWIFLWRPFSIYLDKPVCSVPIDLYANITFILGLR